GKLIADAFEQAAHAMLTVTGYVMLFAPLAVFAAVAATVATQGLALILGFAKIMGGFYLSLLVLLGGLFAAGVPFFWVGLFPTRPAHTRTALASLLDCQLRGGLSQDA